MKVKSLCHAQLLATPWTAAFQAPLSMGFSRQQYWSRVPLSSPHICTRYHKPLPLKKFFLKYPLSLQHQYSISTGLFLSTYIQAVIVPILKQLIRTQNNNNKNILLPSDSSSVFSSPFLVSYSFTTSFPISLFTIYHKSF